MTKVQARTQRIAGVRTFSGTLAHRVEDYWQQFCIACAQAELAVPHHAEFVSILKRVWVYSEFVAKTCIRAPDLVDSLRRTGQLFLSDAPDAVRKRVDAVVSSAADETSLFRALRVLRRRELLRIAFRDLAGWSPLEETLRDLSRFADACLIAVSAKLHRWQCTEWGTPTGRTRGEAQDLVIVAMGKLGAYELNFSSDIDLIFAFPENGDTVGATRTISNEEYFHRLAQRLIAALDATTADGFVFRVDMRLRPFGDSGPLVSSFAALETYYLLHGREWERYAMIKARPLTRTESVGTGSDPGKALTAMLKPFVYRRYLDFGSIAALREMKGLIAAQVHKKGMTRNIKLGAGGIREIEFIGQLFQLVRGGREPVLQQRGIITVLRALGSLGHLPQQTSDELITAYIFLRHVENRLQAFADAQSHVLPEDPLTQLRIALAMGWTEWPPFAAEVARQREIVHRHFNDVFRTSGNEVRDVAVHAVPVNDFEQIWRLPQAEGTAQILAGQGFGDSETVVKRLIQLQRTAAIRAISDRGRAWLDQLMARSLRAAAQTPHPTQTLLRLISIVESIGGRSSYFALLVEYPHALAQLMRLCSASPWITTYVAQYPALLDELLDPRTLYQPAIRDELTEELSAMLHGTDEADIEQQMEHLRQFAHSHILRVAAADVAEAIPLMVVSDHLSDIAEVVVDAALDLARRHLVSKHGEPRTGERQPPAKAGFAVIGYGKLGGLELGYGSDLDLVFLHDSFGGKEMTDGARPLENAVFFARLAQRMIHLLTTHTPSGVAYVVDTRLRPSGASGLLVTSVPSFQAYQSDRAWTWEHQALVRARAIAGDPDVIHRFSQIRHAVLTKRRDAAQLQRDVREMRLRMRRELGNKDPAWFDLKHDAGGIIDIEFIVQYLVLRWAADVPALTRWSDNIRQLETLGKEGLMAAPEVARLGEVYRVLRKEIHRNKLQDAPARVPATKFVQERADISLIWSRYLDGADPISTTSESLGKQN